MVDFIFVFVAIILVVSLTTAALVEIATSIIDKGDK
jgi:hypothetical protein